MDKSDKKSLLYPAMHKLYSALLNLEKFEKGNNLFDNISYLDSFFSEYRNITFVLQKSLKKSIFEHIYIANRDKYLAGEINKWFIDKRNEVLKEHPFQLEKKIKITLYTPRTSISLLERVFSIDNDTSIDITMEALKSVLNYINALEIFFSVDFSFYEKGSDKELLEDLIIGVHTMIAFMNAMKHDIDEDCSLCNKLQEKINKFNFFRLPKEALFIDDYVYYRQEKRFEKSSKGMMFFSENPTLKQRSSTERLTCNYKMNEFDFFIIMHCIALSKQESLMPTFYIIYEDNTFEILSYLSSIKTVTYRKINEIAKRIKSDKIKQVYYATEMIQYKIENYTKIKNSTSPNRTNYKERDILACYKLDKNGNNEVYYFDSDQVGDMKYVSSILKNPSNNHSDDLKDSFLCPIIDSFDEK